MLITVSEETTRVTSPLTAEGYPDYWAALDAEVSRGVTRENNAAVILYQAMGPLDKPEPLRAEYFRRLGMPVPSTPALGGLKVSAWDGYQETKEASASADACDERQVAWYKEQERAAVRPWKKHELPLMSRWLEENDAALDLVVEASRRPRMYSPISELTCGGEVFDLCLKLHAAYGSLRCRAMLRAGEGDAAGAWQDLLAVRRLGALVGQMPTIIDGLASYAVRGVAAAATATLLHFTRPGKAELQALRAELDAIPQPLPLAARYDSAERYYMLDAVIKIATGESDFQKTCGLPAATDRAVDLLLPLVRSRVDWDESLRVVNRVYDRVSQVAAISLGHERRLAAYELDCQCGRERPSVMSLIWSLVTSRGQRAGRRIGEWFMTRFGSTVFAIIEAEVRTIIMESLEQAAFGLAAYRAEHGVYPESLEAAVGELLPAVPPDPFGDGPIRYRRQGEGYLLYSIGPNGRDDGGRNLSDMNPAEFNTNSADMPDDIVLRVP